MKITPERKAEIARQNGAKSKGPVTPEGKQKSARNAIVHGERATALQLFVPPHSAVLANEDRQKFYRLLDAAIAQYRPSSEIETTIVRQIADFQWKIDRNNCIETAMYNRELLRTANSVQPEIPELRDIEICVAAQEALAGNRTVWTLRRDTAALNRQLLQLQRRLLHLQKSWPDDKRTDRTQPEPTAQPIENTTKQVPINGPITKNVIDLYANLFGPADLELLSYEQPPLPGEREPAA